MENHFCTCNETTCPHHPTNHERGCDPCIVKNLARDEMPGCFFNKLGGDTSALTEYTMESFVRFYIATKGLPPEK